MFGDMVKCLSSMIFVWCMTIALCGIMGCVQYFSSSAECIQSILPSHTWWGDRHTSEHLNSPGQIDDDLHNCSSSAPGQSITPSHTRL